MAVASVLVGWVARKALTPAIGPTAQPFITFFPAVAWATWYGGWAWGTVCVFLSAWVADYAFTAPLYTFRIDDPLAFVAFPAAASFIVATIEMLHATRDALAREKKELHETNRRKGEFLAMLAHELRNPLAPIRNSVTLLQMKGSGEREVATARDVIDRQVTQMTRILDDLLDVNRLERGKLELRKERVALAGIVASAVETAGPSIALARHDLVVRLPHEEIFLDADPIRLAQVFANLLHNAAKYTDPGGRILLRAARDASDVLVSVEDSGIGIAADALPTVFDLFAQVPASRDRAQGGMGIGLSLARGLLELHGGSISVRSDGPGKGSTFTVRLPVASQPLHAGASSRVPEMHASKQRILIADDVEDNADTLAMMLRALGHEVHVVYDGESALRVAAAARPDVVLLDLGMPGLSGYDVCRRIREQPWGARMYVIAQTGWGQESDRRSAREAGFDRHLVKPVECEALLEALASAATP